MSAPSDYHGEVYWASHARGERLPKFDRMEARSGYILGFEDAQREALRIVGRAQREIEDHRRIARALRAEATKGTRFSPEVEMLLGEVPE